MNESELHELPGGWVWTTIEDFLLSLESGGRPKGGVRSIKEGIPSIGGEHLLYNGRFDFTDIRYVPREFYEKMNRGKILKRDVLVVKDGATTGKTSFVPDSFPFNEAAVNEHVFILRVFEQYTEPKYLFFWMQSSFGQKCVKDNFQGTAQGGINSMFVKNSNFPFPPLPEQRRIVTKLEELFTRLDAGVSELKKTQAQLKRYRQSVLKAACEGKLVPTEAELAKAEGRTYESADELLERILEKRREKSDKRAKFKESAAPDTNGLPLPQGWNWVESNMICKTITDGDHQPPPQSKEGIPFLVISNIKEGKLDFSQTRFVPENYYQSIQEHRIPRKGDILYSVVGTYGIPAIVDVDRKFCFQRHIALFKPSEYIHDRYMLLVLKSDFTFKQATAFATGTAQLTVSLSGLRKIKIPLPPLAEQRRIVLEVERRLSIADGVEKTVAQSLAQAERLRQSILKKAFEGRLVAQDASDEPAGMLLERIQKERELKGKRNTKTGRKHNF